MTCVYLIFLRLRGLSVPAGAGSPGSQGLGLVQGIDPLPADTVQTSIRPNIIRIPVLCTHSATHSASLTNRATDLATHGPQQGRRCGTSSPTFWMQPSWDDTSVSVSMC